MYTTQILILLHAASVLGHINDTELSSEIDEESRDTITDEHRNQLVERAAWQLPPCRTYDQQTNSWVQGTWDPVRAHRAPQDCGVWEIDCGEGAGACNNACFWHYCLHQLDDDYQYEDNGDEPVCRMPDGSAHDRRPKGDRNRRFSGVGAENAPCRAQPMVQLLYDSYLTHENWDSKEGPNLDSDEWPMAAMKQNDFVKQQWPPRNSISCIPKKENIFVGSQYRYFRNKLAAWSPSSRLYNPRLADQRTCDGKCVQGDKFRVRFNLDNVELPYIQTPHCIPPKDNEPRRCHDEANRFYAMTRYRPFDNSQPGSSSYGNSDGRLSFSYDSAYMNTYKLVGDSGDLSEYKVVVEQSGTQKQDLDIKVFEPFNGKNELVAQGSETNVQDQGEVTVSGSDLADLVVRRVSDCKLEFAYGDFSKIDGTLFAWTSNDQGFNTAFSQTFPINEDVSPWQQTGDKWNRNPNFQFPGAYCQKEENVRVKGQSDGRRTTCWFPG